MPDWYDLNVTLRRTNKLISEFKHRVGHELSEAKQCLSEIHPNVQAVLYRIQAIEEALTLLVPGNPTGTQHTQP